MRDGRTRGRTKRTKRTKSVATLLCALGLVSTGAPAQSLHQDVPGTQQIRIDHAQRVAHLSQVQTRCGGDPDYNLGTAYGKAESQLRRTLARQKAILSQRAWEVEVDALLAAIDPNHTLDARGCAKRIIRYAELRSARVGPRDAWAAIEHALPTQSRKAEPGPI